MSKPAFGHSFRWQALLVASSVACGNQGIEKEAELLGSSVCYTPLPASLFHGEESLSRSDYFQVQNWTDINYPQRFGTLELDSDDD